MSEINYIYFWTDTSNYFLNYGFYTYTPKEVDEFTKIHPEIKFKKMGEKSKINDLSWNMYQAMEHNIMDEDEYILNNDVRWSSHHHTTVECIV